MAYDPTKPVEDSPLDAGEMRNQLTGLKALIDQKTSPDDVTNLITQQAPGKCSNAFDLNMNVSDPPTQQEVQTIADKIDELLQDLKRGA